MAAEVHSDLSLIQDEDVLRRMWADTDDFGRKKEIRGRMYKLREQRLRDLYTGGVDRTQVTRKHQTTRHTESIGEQDFMSMKSKEIRDSESPTRDFSQAVVKTNTDNSGYWTSRQENANTTQQLEGGGIMRETVDASQGSGVIRGLDSETNLVLGSEDRHTVVSKNDDNSTYKAEELKHSSKMAATTMSNSGAVSSSKTENQNVEKSHEEKTSSDNSSTTKSWSSSSCTTSSKKIVSSSYQSSDTQNLKAITSDAIPLELEDSQLYSKRVDEVAKQLKTDSINQESRTSNVEQSQKSTSIITSKRYGQHTAEEVMNETSQVRDSTQKVSDSGAQRITRTEVTTSATSSDDKQSKANQIALAEPESTTAQESKTIVQQSHSDAVCKNEVVSSQATRAESVKSETESVTNHKIMTEIHKLDNYLSSHTPAPSTPASPRSTTDVAYWTIVSKDNRDNEFTYEPRSRDQDNQGPERPPSSPRSHEKVDKNLSNIDLPKGATEGQYVTTYQSHYTRPDRISFDNSPSHDYFASTLRTSPDRQTPSPTKKTASRSSLDRSSPERKWRQSPRTTSSPSVERASPDRPHSQPGQRSSPERKYRTSPSKSPERNAKKSPAKSPQRDVTRKSPAKSPERDVKERKHSTSSYTIERSSSESKKKSDVRTDTKPKRKFSSTQQKELTKIRASTPGSSPNSSPTRPRKVKDTSDSDSDTSQATFKKSKSDIVKSTDVCDSTVVKTVKQQKEESSEYFSEGSVTNEIVKRGKEPSPERSAFTPIKNFRTNPESGAFIVGEKRQIVLESEVVEKKVDQNRILTDVESAEIETAVEVTEVISENEDSVVDKKQITSPQVKTQAGPASPEKPDGKNVESRPGLAKPVQQSTESTVSEMNKTSVTKKSSAKGSTTKTKKEREELRRKAQTDSDTSRSASVSPERKVSSPKKSPGKPSQSPSRPSPQKTPVAEARKPSIKQDSKSPDRKQSRDGSLSPVRSIKSTKRTSKSPSTSPERSTSARSSPERKHTVSSSAKLSDFSSRTEERHTSVSKKSSSPQKTPPRLPDTFASKTPRRSSIPKSEKKLSPRNSKDNMQVKAGNRNTPHAQPAANQPALRPVQKTISQSPQKLKNSTVNRSLDIDQKRVAPKSSTTTRTVVTNKTTVKTTTTSNVSRASDVAKPIIQNGVRPAHPGTQRKPLATSNKKPASPATTPKRPSPQTSRPVTNTAKPTSKPAMTPTRVTPQKTIEKNPTSSLPSKSQVKTKPSMSLAKQDSKIKSKQFIEDEVHNVTSDLEDSVPPEYFDIEIVDTSRENIAQQKSETKNTVLNARRVMNISQDRISHDRKLRKRDSIKDRDSPSLSSDDETDHAPSSTIKQEDYLNVVVQHPKSSRESSPGYTSERIPVSTTSDDGESNPRYADFVSEPEDVEIFDNLRGPRGPIPLREDLTQRIDEEEVDILSRTSVADKVNVFMEAAKQSKETPETHQPIEIDSSHSVRSAKTLFENISKTQATTSQTIKVVNIYENNSEPVPETPNGTTQTVNVEANDKIRLVTSTPKDVQERLSKHQDEVDEPLSTKKQTYQERTPVIEPVILKKKAYETLKKEETTLFKEREIDESRKTTRKDTPVPEPLDTTTKPSKKPFERKPSASSADVNSKKNFFERKVQEQSKTVLKNTRDSNVSSLDKHQAEAKTSVNLDSLMRSTVASSVRAQSPDKVHKPVERKRTAENLTDKKEDVPAGKGRNVDTHRETSPLRDPYTLKVERKTSAEFTSARTERRQSSQSNEVPSYLTKTSSKPVDNDFGSPAKVRDTSVKKVSTSEEAMAKSTGKFGVTLKKSSSKTKMLPSTSGPAEKKPVNKELVEIEEIMDLEILEAMLVKAVAYEERRRIRAQIRLVKKQLEDEHNRNGNRIPLATPTKTKAWPPKEKSPERNVSALISSRNVKADSSWTSSSRRSPERKPSTEIKQTSYKETITTSSRESPERKLSKPKPRESPERYVSNQRRSQSPERIVHYPSRSSPERKTSNQIDKKSSDSKDITTYQATVKTQSTRSVTTSEVKTTSATDSITSSYGVGPTDDNGRPLFGLRALRRTDTSKTLEDGEHHEEDVVIEEKSESRRTSATSGDILDSTGRPLFGGLKALQSETMPTQTNQLSELVDRNTRLVQGETRMESTKTVMTSHSSMTSDGKVSVKRNVVRGELSAKNGEEPVGRVTQSTYSYSKDDRTAVPQITSKTVTSHIGGRRDSGPKIEEITDGSHTTSQSSRRYSKEYTVEEDNSTSTDRRNSAGLNEDNVRTFTSLIRNKDSSARKSSLESEETVLRSSKTSDESTRKTLTRGDSIKALQHKYQQATEAANQPTSRNYPKAGLILRSNSLHAADDHTKLSSNMKQVSTSSVQSTTGTSDLDGTTVTSTQTRTSEDSRTVRTSTAPVGTRSKSTSQTSTTVSRTEATTPLGGPTSFLDNSNKVTGVQDILQRMRNADLVSETGDTTEDTEARALLNKFLGASVILQGMEQGMRAAATQSSTTLVNEANKKLVKATDQRNQDDIYDITDEHQLQILLDASSDYDERKKLRARLREVMAEKKGGSSEVAGEGGSRSRITPQEGECNVLQRMIGGGGFDDSGTESGEDLRHLNPEVVEEVKSALTRLEGVIPGLDPVKRDAVTQLVNSLQSCLQLVPQPPPVPPPRRFGSRKALRNRHTVGVTSEEIVQARKWVDQENLQRRESASSTESILSKVFRPVRFSPPAPLPEAAYTQMTLVRKMYHKPPLLRVGYFMEPTPQQGTLSYVEPEPAEQDTQQPAAVERSISDSSSIYDYDPSIHLFTPEQSVQIAVHKAAINKQIKIEDAKRRGSSEDGDVSSADEDEFQGVSSAKRLLQMASSDTEKKARFAVRTTKKLKMKRANTVDIPKPSKFYDYSSDDYGASADETRDDMGNRSSFKGFLASDFVPKTENDHKFLAFLKQVNEKSPTKVMSYNPSARGGKHWHNRFSSIKTAFEGPEKKQEELTSPSPAKLFWQNNQKQESKKSVEQKVAKLPWTVKSTEENGVVVGSLTVAKPGHINQFNHAPKSAFRPVEKAFAPSNRHSASGSVKQLVNHKFTVSQQTSPDTKPKLGKPEVKSASVNHISYKNDHDKLASFNQNAVATHKYYNIPSHVVSQEPERRTPSAFAPYKQKPEAIPPKNREEPVYKSYHSYHPPKFDAGELARKPEQYAPKVLTSTNDVFPVRYNSNPNHFKRPTSFHQPDNRQAMRHQENPNNNNYSVKQRAHDDFPQHHSQSNWVASGNGFEPQDNSKIGSFVPVIKPFASAYTEPKPQFPPSENHFTPAKNGNSTVHSSNINESNNMNMLPAHYNGNPTNQYSYNPEPKESAIPDNRVNSYKIAPQNHEAASGRNGQFQPEDQYPKNDVYFQPNVSESEPPGFVKDAPVNNYSQNGSYSLYSANHPELIKMQSEPIMDSAYQNPQSAPRHEAPILLNTTKDILVFSKPDNDVLSPLYEMYNKPMQQNTVYENPNMSENMPQSPQRMTIHPPDNHGRPTIGNSSISIFVNPVASPNAIADAAELNREVQNLTKIEDTRVLEIQDKHFSNNVANGPYLCNLRDASTINTDGEFVSNVLATSPGLRDSHYVSPRPVSKSPRLDGPTFLPPSQTPNSLGVDSAHNDHIFYNNTVSTKPPTSLRVHNDERPKTSSPYQNGRVHSQSPSPVRSSSSQILGPIGGVGSPDQECKAVSRVMGQAQCQTAVTINNRTRRRFEEPNKLDLRIQLTASARQRALSPTFPNVLQKSESWHQLVREQMHQAKQAPPAPSPSLPKIARAKSSHSLNQYKQYEATLQPDASLANKKITVSQYLSKKAKHSLSNKSRHKSLGNIATFDDEIEDVDEAFESIFQENNRKRNSKYSSESSEVVTKSGTTFSKTEVQTRVVSSSAKLTKANSIQSPFAKFKQLERQNSAPSVSRTGSFTLPSSASSIKERLLEWVQAQTRDYKNVKIDNFSTSWSDGLAFCALIHHFCPDAFDYSVLTPKDQRHNFQLAFTVAEEKADIYPLLDVEDMVMMSRPDWKCVFTYVQSIYRRFHDSPLSNPTNPYL